MNGRIILENDDTRLVLCERGGCAHPDQHGILSPLCDVDGCSCGESCTLDERVLAAMRATILVGSGWVIDPAKLLARGIQLVEPGTGVD